MPFLDEHGASTLVQEIKSLSDLRYMPIGTEYKMSSLTATLMAENWSEVIGEDEYSQTINNVNFFKASGYIYFVSPSKASKTDYQDNEIYANDVAIDGAMSFSCKSIPNTNVIVNIVRMVSV